eukprot:14837803-Alexandrium_andersonii.AAC.1
MSASLVGSEMCIRDSFSHDQDAIAPRRAAGSSSSPRGHLRPGAVVGPVSYTHLTLPTICSV